MHIGEIPVGGGAPLVLIAGLNVIESEEAAVSMAGALREITAARGMPLVFKASVDKANRSSLQSFRGPGLDEGLRVLARVRARVGIPVTTDVHEPGQAKPVAECVDCLQIPAFLCRQTDLIAACAATGKPLNVKKGQFLAPGDARHIVEKARHFGSGGVLVTERGSTFGPHDLVVDMRGLVRMRKVAPVGLDATHAVQQRVAEGLASGGEREMVAPLARAAVAVGVDALFVEVHEDPTRAPCDGPSQIDVESFEGLVAELDALERALRPLRKDPPGGAEPAG